LEKVNLEDWEADGKITLRCILGCDDVRWMALSSRDTVVWCRTPGVPAVALLYITETDGYPKVSTACEGSGQ
jgi:hypothetical protein